MEDQSFVRVLEYRKKKSFISFSFLYFILSMVILIGMALLISQYTRDESSATTLFITMVFFILAFMFIFVDSFFAIGLFYPRRSLIGSSLLGLAILVTVILVLLDLFKVLFTKGNGDIVTTMTFFTTLFASIMSIYYLQQGNPVQKDQSLITKFEAIRDNLKITPMSALGIDAAVNRALIWLQFEQSEEGIWNKDYPLYETSEILYTLFRYSPDLSYSWNAVFNGIEETRTTEQVFYSVLDASSTSMFDDSFTNIFPRCVLGEINAKLLTPSASDKEEAITKIRNFARIDDHKYEELKTKLLDFSAWDFVTEMEKLQGKREYELPSIFAIGPLTTIRFENKIAQTVADILSETFSIVLSRSTTRFNTRGDTKDVPSHILALIYNTLIEMKRLNRLILQKIEAMTSKKRRADEIEIPDIVLPGTDDNIPSTPTIPDISLPTSSTPNIPNVALDAPFQESTDENTGDQDLLSIDLRLPFARKHILEKQEIDGGWDGDPLVTAECLQVITHNQSVEDEKVKMAVNFLLATQKDNGSWKDDYVTTARVVRSLLAIKGRVMVRLNQ